MILTAWPPSLQWRSTALSLVLQAISTSGRRLVDMNRYQMQTSREHEAKACVNGIVHSEVPVRSQLNEVGLQSPLTKKKQTFLLSRHENWLALSFPFGKSLLCEQF